MPFAGQWPCCGRCGKRLAALSWSLERPGRRQHAVTATAEVDLNLLWLTLADPDPATNGQLVYSKGLVEAVHGAGARLQVIGLARPESPVRADVAGLHWSLHARE